MRLKTKLTLVGSVCLILQGWILFLLSHLKNPLSALYLQLTFSPGFFRNQVMEWDIDERAAYLRHYIYDFAYPLAYGCFLYLLVKELYPRKKILWALPWVATVADFTENLSHIYSIGRLFTFNDSWLYLGSGAAWLKWAVIFVIITLLAVQLVKRRRA